MKQQRRIAILTLILALAPGATCDGGDPPAGGGTGGGVVATGGGGAPAPTPPVEPDPPAPPAEPARISIEAPLRDSIAVAGQIDARGEVSPAAAVSVQVGNTSSPAQVNGGRWEALGVALLSTSTSVLTARSGASEASVLVTRGDVAPQTRQRFRIDWTPEADVELAGIAADTLDGPLTPIQKSAFVQAVKSRTASILITRYADWDFELSTAPGPDVHTIQMLGFSGDIFGQSPYDCGNRRLQETSEVWVGTYRRSMSHLDDWSPMQRGDTLQTRIEDVAQALARTGAHEMGHSVGLVGEDVGNCGWMRGCDGGHDCDLVDASQPLADRFDHGRFIMDPGGKTRNRARLAEPIADQRAALRDPARFNDFDAAYFSIVHPAP